jgi:hypothetical protein
MQPKEKLKNIIIAWIIVTLIVIVLLYILLQSEISFLKEILILLYFIIPPIITGSFYRSQQMDLIKYLKNKHINDYEKYAYSELWEEDYPGYKFAHFIFIKQNDTDEKIVQMKELIQYTYLFLGFQFLFSFALIALSISGFHLLA